MKIYRTTFDAMGGSNEITIVADDEATATHAMRAAVAEVQRIQTKYSRYHNDAESIVYRINQSAGRSEWIECDAETLHFFQIANDIYEISEGLFDITSGVLRKAWDFKREVMPTQEILAPLLALVDWRKLERRGNQVRLAEKNMQIDFGGFGKEYAADCAAQVLKVNRITFGYINLGGDIRAVGPQPDGQPWLIGVQNPRKKGEIVATFPLFQGGLATSGDSEKFFIKAGKRYCHILNPSTGYPVNCWSSVSIGAVTTLQAGVYSTVAMLMENKAEKFLAKSGCGFLLVDQQGQTILNQPPK